MLLAYARAPCLPAHVTAATLAFVHARTYARACELPVGLLPHYCGPFRLPGFPFACAVWRFVAMPRLTRAAVAVYDALLALAGSLLFYHDARRAARAAAHIRSSYLPGAASCRATYALLPALRADVRQAVPPLLLQHAVCLSDNNIAALFSFCVFPPRRAILLRDAT